MPATDAPSKSLPRFSITSASTGGSQSPIPLGSGNHDVPLSEMGNMTGDVSPPASVAADHILDNNRRPSTTGTSQPTIRLTPSTTFSKTIQDLEGLLEEAVQIARAASEEREIGEQELRSRLASLSDDGVPEFKITLEETVSNNQKIPSVKVSEPVRQSGLQVKAPAERRVSYIAQQDWAQSSAGGPSLQRHPTFQVNGRPNPPAPVSACLTSPSDRVLRRKAPNEDIPSRDDDAGIESPGQMPSDSHLSSNFGSPGPLRRVQTLAERRLTHTFNPVIMANRKESWVSHEEDSTDHFNEIFALDSPRRHGDTESNHIDLHGCRHVDLQGPHDFDVHETRKRQPVARDWTRSRKRFAAWIACVNTSLLGVIIGIYAGEVPAIQYVLVDLRHQAIRGNVYLYLGLAIPTLLLWPLPLLHGRKPYSIISLAAALCLQIPQGIAVTQYRSPDSPYLSILLLSRGFLGIALGFANINQQATLLDLFGASLQSRNPHEETVDSHDVRRHGGGMGLWLGVWSWCLVGSIGLGFFIGTLMVNRGSVAWGFWITLLLLMVVLLLNVIGPEVRRSAYRRTVAELMGDDGNVNSRICKGEVKMHLKSSGPYWWGEEVKAGMELSWKMIKQPGFAVLAIYIAWVYSHFTLVLMLLGALASRYYRLQPVFVGLCVLALGVGSALALPFQKASFFSRSRRHRARTDSMTMIKVLTWSSHLLRRTVFTALLPLAGLGYTFASRGPPIAVAIPAICAGIVGFLSNLAIAECNGLIMETFDTSDLQAGMTGKAQRRATIAARGREQRTNFTCYPRVMAGFAVSQCLSFCFAAIATGVCGGIERRLGALQASGVVAGILLSLTVLLTLVLVRFRVVRMIPEAKPTFKTQFLTRANTTWEPTILGKPSGTTRKISILEAGDQTRWSEIRRRNRLTGDEAF